MFNRNFWIVMSFTSLICLVSSTFAQDKKLNDRTKQRIETRLKNMTKDVGLKPEQVKKIEEILVNDALAAPFDRSRMRDMSREERMDVIQKMRENQEKTNKKIEKLLTAEQVKKFKTFIKKENSQRRGRGRR